MKKEEWEEMKNKGESKFPPVICGEIDFKRRLLFLFSCESLKYSLSFFCGSPKPKFYF